MNNAELGRRLKAARLAKKMTQSEVVGNYITRNMLSQIESGTAAPSMKTLEYLAGVLELPMERLLAEQELPEAQDTAAALQKAKAHLQNKEYASVLRVKDASGQFEDELQAMRSIAHLELAQKLKAKGKPEHLQEAVMHARKASEEAALGIYANETRQAQASQLIAELAQALSTYYSDLARQGAPAGDKQMPSEERAQAVAYAQQVSQED